MSTPVQYILAVLAIVGLGASQVFGIGGGFICQCSGEQVITYAPDCESGGCHDHEDEDHDRDAPGIPHEHQKLTQALLGHTFVQLVVELPPLSVCAALPGVNCHFLTLAETLCLERPAHAPSGCGPPQSVHVARTVVMLV
jgi:hypothetical protein